MTRNLKLGLWLVAAVGVAVAGYLLGQSLKASEEYAFAFDLGAPAYQPTEPYAGLSLGGFSGLDAPTNEEGRLVISGRVVEKAANRVTIETPWGERTTLRITGADNLRRLDAAERDALQTGAMVVVRTKPGSSDAVSVIVLAP